MTQSTLTVRAEKGSVLVEISDGEPVTAILTPEQARVVAQVLARAAEEAEHG